MKNRRSVYQKNIGTLPDATQAVVHQVAMANARAEASHRLGARLKKVHGQMPDIDEQEAERLINAEVTGVRAARRMRMTARPARARSRRRVKR